MEFTVVGSGTSIPSAERGSPCYHLAVESDEVVFDLGSGAVRQLWCRGFDIRDITVLALSHFHPDHTADLVPFLFALRNPEFGRPGRLRLLGPAGLKEYFTGLGQLYGDWIRPLHRPVEIEEVRGEVRDFDRWRLRSALTGHTAGSLAFRAERTDGPAIVYGGDSPYSEPLIELALGADVLVLECSFPEDRPVEGHLTPSLAARMAALAAVPRLVLTHFYPAADQSDLLAPAKKHYDGEILLAYDGLKLEV